MAAAAVTGLPPGFVLDDAPQGAAPSQPAALPDGFVLDQPQQTGALDAFSRGVGQGATLGLADESMAAAAASPLPISASHAPTADNPIGVSVGNPIDVAAGLGRMLFGGGGDDYSAQLQQERAADKQAASDHPVANFAGNIAGGLVLPGAAAGQGAKAAATTGAAAGALYGFGQGEGTSDRLIDAATGGALGAAVGGAVGAIGSRLGGGAQAPNAVVEAGDRLGVSVPRAVATDSRMVQAAGAGARNVPFAGEPLMQAAEKTVNDLGGAADTVAKGYGATTPAAAGNAARDAIAVGWKGRTQANLDKLYGAVDNMVDQNARAPLAKTQGTVAQILAERQAQRVSDPGKAVSFVADAVQDPNGLTYQGIKGLRERVGEMLKNPQALASADVSERELRRIYGALSDDLRDVVQAAGGSKAVAAFNRANDYARLVAERRKNLQRIVGAQNDEGVLERLTAAASSRGRADVALLQQARKAAGPDAWDEVAGTVVSRLGRDPEGQFSPQRFLTDFGKLSPEGRALLFNSTGKSDLARSLTDIATVSSRFKELQKYANPSGTARGLGFTGAGYGLAVDPVTTLATIVGGNALSRVLAQPATASSMARWARAYEVLARKPAAGTLASFNVASRNLASTLADKLGLNVGADDLLRAVSGQQPAAADQNGEGQNIPAVRQ